MSDPRLLQAATKSSSQVLETRVAPFVRLKHQLVKFWNSQEFQRDPMMDEISANSPNRERAASFIPKGSRILDVACGTAANAKWLLQRGTYLGVDISQNYLRLSRQPELQLICADAEFLPFRDTCFDAAVLTFALEHSVNPVGMLREMCRVVRPAGRIVLLGPSWDLPFWYPNAMQSKARIAGWHREYTLSRLRGQLRGWFLGRLPFLLIEDPDALSHPFVHDADAVYVVWSYEVIRQMKRWGWHLIHAEVDDRMLGTRIVVRLFKRLLYLLPPYRLAGSTVLMVFEG